MPSLPFLYGLQGLFGGAAQGLQGYQGMKQQALENALRERQFRLQQQEEQRLREQLASAERQHKETLTSQERGRVLDAWANIMNNPPAGRQTFSEVEMGGPPPAPFNLYFAPTTIPQRGAPVGGGAAGTLPSVPLTQAPAYTLQPTEKQRAALVGESQREADFERKVKEFEEKQATATREMDLRFQANQALIGVRELEAQLRQATAERRFPPWQETALTSLLQLQLRPLTSQLDKLLSNPIADPKEIAAVQQRMLEVASQVTKQFMAVRETIPPPLGTMTPQPSHTTPPPASPGPPPVRPRRWNLPPR